MVIWCLSVSLRCFRRSTAASLSCHIDVNSVNLSRNSSPSRKRIILSTLGQPCLTRPGRPVRPARAGSGTAGRGPYRPGCVTVTRGGAAAYSENSIFCVNNTLRHCAHAVMQ